MSCPRNIGVCVCVCVCRGGGGGGRGVTARIRKISRRFIVHSGRMGVRCVGGCGGWGGVVCVCVCVGVTIHRGDTMVLCINIENDT